MSTPPQRVVPNVWMLPFEIGQAYVWDWGAGLTVIDTGVPGSAGAILNVVRAAGRTPTDVKEIVLTHHHYDHRGSAAELVAQTGAAVLAHPADAAVVNGTQSPLPPRVADFERPIAEMVLARMAPDRSPASLSLDELGPALMAAVGAEPVQVDRPVQDGDQTLGGGTILHRPGHTPGSIMLYARNPDILFTGDTLAVHEGTMIPGVFHVDRAELMRSIATLADLDVEVACFGHGAPVIGGAGQQIRALVRPA
jgi:glyoxylase-like metal-dependent hydrolase (beta-lactamase superfamily II)